jgi:predicted nucleic acid-binding protein
VREHGTELVAALVTSEPVLATARLSVVEVRRNLARLLEEPELSDARARFATDAGQAVLVELDADLCEAAAVIAESTGLRTLDALHLAAAQRLSSPELTFLTFDVRQARAARLLGLRVTGVDPTADS